jgi:ribose/xylose/arabinose/galactoside ABC-type transport system permease subunit
MKGNKMMRMLSVVVLISLAATDFSGEFDLLHPSFLWLAAFVSFMAFQASFTGFCPAGALFANKKQNACCGK